MLFSTAELTDYLQYTVTDAQAAIAERVVWGWMKPLLGLDDRPSPVPEDVFSWAVELGAIVHENPNGSVTASSTGATSDTFGPRRQEILNDVALWGGGTATAPRGSFPPANYWPESPEYVYQRIEYYG
jgi:hypothetical protein